MVMVKAGDSKMEGSVLFSGREVVMGEELFEWFVSAGQVKVRNVEARESTLLGPVAINDLAELELRLSLEIVERYHVYVPSYPVRGTVDYPAAKRLLLQQRVGYAYRSNVCPGLSISRGIGAAGESSSW